MSEWVRLSLSHTHTHPVLQPFKNLAANDKVRYEREKAAAAAAAADADEDED